MKWVGSRWWKFDFHNHTPASDDYGKGLDQAQHKLITHKDWLLNYMRVGIDCVAITDHNSGASIDGLKQALIDLSIENHPEYRSLCIFPGVEITVQGNIHILAIFPESKTTSDIDSLLGAVKYLATKGKSDGCSECSAVQVIDEITRFGGIAIPAHVDQQNGLFTETGNTLSQVLDHKSVFAMEVIDPSKPKPQMYINKRLKWSEVLGSDSHHPTGAAGKCFPGSHFTWIKMSEPSFEGLKLALIDGTLSVKRSDQVSHDPNIYGPLTIESIIVDDAKYLGRGQSFSCHLNPWLNTIIGGRGTGKSTSLEFLRLALQRKDEIPKNLKEEFAKYSQTSNSRQDDGLLNESTIITIKFYKDGKRFLVKWDNSGKKHSIEEETTPDVWNLTEGDITQRFPVRIYSQKQIFELAKHPQALLQVIDDAPEVNYRGWKLEWDELISTYLSIRAQEREVQVVLQEESITKGQLEDIKRKLEVFENAGHANILKTYQLRQNQGKAIESWEKSWASSAEKLRTLFANLLPSEIDTQNFSSERVEDEEFLSKTASVQSFFQRIQTEMQQVANQIDGAYKKWQDEKSSLEIYKKINEANQEYTNLLAQLSHIGASDPAAYAQLVKQRQDLEEKLKKFDKKREILSQHQKNSEDSLTKIYEHRQKITELRNQFLKKTLADNSYVKIDVIPFGNTVTVEEELRNLIDRGNGGFDRDIGTIDGDEGLLSNLNQKSLLSMERRVAALKSTLVGINVNEPEAISYAKDRRFISHIQSLTPEQIDRIKCWFPEDSLDVRYSLKDKKSFKPLEQGSPGQKTAALLAFILSYGDEPLVLDQPEDDLDNYLIYDLIVTQLREIKQRRQIIIVTHNANIVVNGDAENVIALDIRVGKTQIVTQGGLQESSIRAEICRVMEGGHEAFEQRYRRISVANG